MPAVCPAPTGLPLFGGGPPVVEGCHRLGTRPLVPGRVPFGGHFGFGGCGGGGDDCCSNDLDGLGRAYGFDGFVGGDN